MRTVCKTWNQALALNKLAPKQDTPLTRLALILSIRCNKIEWIKDFMHIEAKRPQIDADAPLKLRELEYPYEILAAVDDNRALRTAIQYKRLEAARILIEGISWIGNGYLMIEAIKTNYVDMMRLFMEQFEKGKMWFNVVNDEFSMLATIMKHTDYDVVVEFLRWACNQEERIQHENLVKMVLHPCVLYRAVEFGWTGLVKTLLRYTEERRQNSPETHDPDTLKKSPPKRKRWEFKPLSKKTLNELICYIAEDSDKDFSIAYHDGTPSPTYLPIHHGNPEMLKILLDHSSKYDALIMNDIKFDNRYDEYDYDTSRLLWQYHRKKQKKK